MDFFAIHLEKEVVQNITSSVLAVLALFVLRFVVLRLTLGKDMPAEVRRRVQVNSRNAVFIAALLALVFVWAQEVRTLALSAVAVAAAIVLATKELIMCLSGALYRASSGAFKVGDRIEIGTFRGDVIDQTLLSTTVLEIGPGQAIHQHTGRIVALPNSMLLTAAVINETFTEDYVLHVFTVPMKIEDDWQRAEKMLLDAARKECESFLDEARRHFDKLQNRFSMETIQVDPRVTVFLPEPGRVNLLVRIPAPTRRKGRIEQAIVKRFLDGLKPKQTA